MENFFYDLKDSFSIWMKSRLSKVPIVFSFMKIESPDYRYELPNYSLLQFLPLLFLFLKKYMQEVYSNRLMLAWFHWKFDYT
jgi:hypothetical protein